MKQPGPWTLILFGAALIVAAATGGGVSLLGIEIPVLDSLFRQVLVGLFGVIFFTVGWLVRSAAGTEERQKAAPGRRTVPGDGGDSLPSIAPLPFDVRGWDENEAFSEDLLGILIANLSGVKGLRTIPKKDVMKFKGSDIREIGEELEAQWVLRGSLDKQGDRCRIEARLLRVKEGQGDHRWTKTYVESWTSMQELGETVAWNVGTEFLKTLSEEDKRALSARPSLLHRLFPGFRKDRPAGHPTENRWALRAYAKGQEKVEQFNNLRRRQDLRDAEGHLKRATDLDEEYVDAWAELGFLNILRWETDADPRWLDGSKRIWRRILDLEPGHALAQAEFGYLVYVTDADSVRAVELARRAVTENPEHPIAHNVLALLYIYLGFYEANYRIEEEEVFEREPDYIYPYTNAALALQLMGDFPGALQQAQTARWKKEDALVAILLEGAQHFYRGEADVAERVWREGLRVCPESVKPILEVALAWIAAQEGDLASARTTVRTHVKDAWLRGPYGPYFISLCALAGEADRAIDMLEEESTYAASYRYLLSERTLRPLVHHPRYRHLLERRFSAWQEDLEQLGPGLPEQPPSLPGPEEFTRQAWDAS